MSLDEMATIAARYDTSMAWAMLRALADMGIVIATPRTASHAYDHLRWCFANHGSPMDAFR